MYIYMHAHRLSSQCQTFITVSEQPFLSFPIDLGTTLYKDASH